MALLRLLPVAQQLQGGFPARHLEVDLERVGAGHRQAQLLGLAADLVVVHGQPGAEDDGVDPVQRRPAKSELLRERRERRGGRVGRDAEENVEVRINVFREADLASLGSPGGVGQVQVAAAGDLVGEHLPAAKTQFRQDPVLQALVEHVVRVTLNGQRGVLQKGESCDLLRIRQVDQDADALARFGFEHGLEQSRKAELRKSAVRGSCYHGDSR